MGRGLRALLLLLSVACGEVAPAAAPAPAPPSPPEPAVAPSPAPEVPDTGPPVPDDAVRARVLLTTFGRFDDSLREVITTRLEEELAVEVDVLPGEALPRDAYYPPRRRYRAAKLLDHLRERLEGEPATTRVLGMTSVDVSVTKPPHEDWGVLGLGDIGGRACVISTFRMRRRGLRDRAHLEFRASSTAVHEVGHTLGLEHCEEHRCVMNDARGTIRTIDGSTGRLGPECLAELDEESPRVHPRSGGGGSRP